MEQPIIQMEHVSFAYRAEEPLIQDVTFDIPKGQWVTIVGANGSGKSTLVKLLNALLSKKEGRIHIAGIELDSSSKYDIRKQIGFIFQNPDNQFIGQSVKDDIIFGLENLGLSQIEMDKRIHKYAGRMNITHLLEKHPGQLSGGQKQRAAIASILAMEPNIIVFDEATSMLDELATQDMIAIMQEMQASGQYTLISITHDMDEIAASDRVLAMERGSIIADASPQELFKQDHVMHRCRLKKPFIHDLIEQLHRRGVRINSNPTNEEELVKALWQLHSST
ncbi:energy-coupling factor transporter ATPase [Paenibacillus sp. N1-5-1-14]|uniref:energy-coupling factor transporter ATPase n=1 Tax=Paenibacillus radicibacter TaxID=2972488 RepID=UPI002158F891|nr:energy-coupling factor transporter ATPase [Paenibacillus radicibacter]MCR8645272.1 energy-coupling factor transporter ATPase [Paenibacillus radicibacter]